MVQDQMSAASDSEIVNLLLYISMTELLCFELHLFSIQETSQSSAIELLFFNLLAYHHISFGNAQMTTTILNGSRGLIATLFHIKYMCIPNENVICISAITDIHRARFSYT